MSESYSLVPFRVHVGSVGSRRQMFELIDDCTCDEHGVCLSQSVAASWPIPSSWHDLDYGDD